MPDEPSFSFATAELSGTKPVPMLGGTPSIAPMAQDEPVKQDPLRAPSEATVDVAYKWAQLYKNDVEYEQFFDWIGRRSNSERTDFKQILDSLPLNFGPEDLPPPLRRYFLGRFG